MTKKRTPRTKYLPKYGTLNRTRMMPLVEGPYFTNEELEDLKNRYTERGGLTWEEIEGELQVKNLFLKKPTFRKYIQDGLLPDARSYRNNDRGRVAVFPADTISHINFIQYFYKIATGQIINELFSLVADSQISSLEAIESRLFMDRGLVASIYYHIAFDDNDAAKGISEALAKRPEFREEVLARLNDIDNAFENQIGPMISSLISLLKETKMFSFELPDDETVEVS